MLKFCKYINYSIRVLVCGLGILLCVQAQAQTPVKVRVAGLESNDNYVSLLRSEQSLKTREDSISNVVAGLRQQLRANPDNRTQYSGSIMKLEGILFEIRSTLGMIEGEISMIEQEYILNNLNKTPEQKKAPISETLPKQKNLFRYTENLLSASDRDNYVKACNMEQKIAGMVETYYNNYSSLEGIIVDYDSATDAAKAKVLQQKFNDTEFANKAIADSIAERWSFVYDNKTYAFNLLMDKEGKTDVLEQFASQIKSQKEQQSKLRGKYTSDAVAFYPAEKRITLNCELSAAQLIGDTITSDSISYVLNILDAMSITELTKINLTERIFIEYSNAEILSKSPYSASNPIKKTVIYNRGTIYRILLGTYTVAQKSDIFKNVSPISLHIDTNKKFNYYAGGYRTVAEAAKAVASLKRGGFKRLDVTVWENGVYRKITAAELIDAGTYRVEILSPDETLPQPIKELIEKSGKVSDIVMVTAGENDKGFKYMFVIGTLSDKVAAQKLADDINELQSTLLASVTQKSSN